MMQQWKNVSNKMSLTQGGLDDEVYFGRESKNKSTKDTKEDIAAFNSLLLSLSEQMNFYARLHFCRNTW